MINVVTIDLAPLGIILPSDRVGMVIAQPYVDLTANEPFQYKPTAKAGQLAVLGKTLEVARGAHHGATKTHFTIFPEYSIPGLDGVVMIEASLNESIWPTGTIVIGGTDGLSKADFITLASKHNTNLDTVYNGLDRIMASEWVNCEITWVKASNGTVYRWLQPKLSRAWPEQNVYCQDMFLGKSVFTFKGRLENETQYRFSTLVCFDWIATVDDKKPWRWVVDGLQQQVAQAGGDETSLSWFFIIQCNRKPSNDTFLNEVSGFFDQTASPSVRRERACLVFANSAGKVGPGRADLFGCTSLVFSPHTMFKDPTCHMTFSNGGMRFRSSTLLSAYHDVLFRERGTCIHSFTQVNPNSLKAGAVGKTIAIEHAFVFPLNGPVDPRAPAAAVPACIKWFNDELDTLPSLSVLYPSAALAGQADAIHQQLITNLRTISAQSADHAIRLAASKSKATHADEWDQPEAEAVEHLVHTLDIIEIGFPNSKVGVDPAHATAFMNGHLVDILAIRGDTHEACIHHSKTFIPLPRRQVIVVSRDYDNTPWRKKFGNFLEPDKPRLGEERKITDPLSGVIHIGYAKLLDIFRTSQTVAFFQGTIYAELTA